MFAIIIIIIIMVYSMSKKEWYALQRANKLRDTELERLEYQQRNIPFNGTSCSVVQIE